MTLKIALGGALLAVSACTSAEGTSTGTPLVMNSRPVATAPVPRPEDRAAVAQVFQGKASWYGAKFQGRPTASGEPFDMNGMTAAHRTLPFGTKVRVINPSNGRSVVVRVNDRGPFSGGRIIDLSRRAAEEIGLKNRGVGPVKLEVLAGV